MCSRSQSTAESAGASSGVSATATSQPTDDKSSVPAALSNAAGDPNRPRHDVAPSGPPPEVLNRQALERRAGKDACKLLLRSTPTAAHVYVDGVLVGDSPLLLFVAPGKYRIEMRGRRMDFGEHAVDLLPRETREVVVSLASRYPTWVSVH